VKEKHNVEYFDTQNNINETSFSSLSKIQKIDYVACNSLVREESFKKKVRAFWHNDNKIQDVFDQFSENTLTNYYLPYGVVPDILIDGKSYCVPMVTEESSVVAAAAKSAKFWRQRGGINTQVLSTTKVGQVHFHWQGSSSIIQNFFDQSKQTLFQAFEPVNANMKNRGGGVKDIVLLDKTSEMDFYYQLFVTFETCDAMGANFINSILENLARNFSLLVAQNQALSDAGGVEIIMSIVSNYNPECMVRAFVECDVDELRENDNYSGMEFARKFQTALNIAKIDTYRAVTNNKGIFNGVDALALATGNDFRAIEAAGHAYAARDGKYKGLTKVEILNNRFYFQIEMPLALGTIGGLTLLHPMAKESLEMLGRPSARQLMGIMASVGLMQNFAAVKSLVTTGIQKGHMKMHLMNILITLEASEYEKDLAKIQFLNEVISYSAVRNFLQTLRQYH